jgi:Pyridoxamine 5'-phosphate oxidase
MAEPLPGLTPELTAFLLDQPCFFVATAPSGPGGRVNLSPKGLDTLRVLGPNECAYLDLTGSGNETSAHLLENGRITLMVCSFGERPRILRVYGRGAVHLPGEPRWDELRRLFGEIEGVRQIVTLAIDRVATSCGYGVPRMAFLEARPTLEQWTRAKGEDGLRAYRAEKNQVSIDGRPTHLGARRRAAESAPR